MPWIKTPKYLLFYVINQSLSLNQGYFFSGWWKVTLFLLPVHPNGGAATCYFSIDPSEGGVWTKQKQPQLRGHHPPGTGATSLEHSCMRMMALGAVLRQLRQLMWRTVPPWPGKTD